MIRTNLFPAILLAGPPHSGKSVLAYQLTLHLREMGIAHYLLRAVPDGEGDWFMSGPSDVVRTLRSNYKTGYSPEFIGHMQTAIDNRLLPLLVDIGGKPQGEQLGILKACTHSILLYRTDEERGIWQKLLNAANLLPIAELRSVQNEEESTEQRQPFISGKITGLEREKEKQKIGMIFGILLERVAGICSYVAPALEEEHFRHAPYPVVNERGLANNLSVPVEGERTVWSPAHLTRISEFVPQGKPLAIYGRGPVWLAAALATHALPSACAIFDARYGWLLPPTVRFLRRGVNLETRTRPFGSDNTWLEVLLPGGTLEPEEIVMTPLENNGGIVISGKMPRWLFASLARKLALDHAWVAVDDPRMSRAIIIHSNNTSALAGDVISRAVDDIV